MRREPRQTVGALSLEYDLYDEDDTTIVFTGTAASAIPLTDGDNKVAVTFGGGVTPNISSGDGTVSDDCRATPIFSRIRPRINVTTASDAGTSCTINVRHAVQE